MMHGSITSARVCARSSYFAPPLSSLRRVRKTGERVPESLRRFTALSEVLEAAKAGDGSPPEAHPETHANASKKGAKGTQGVIWFSNIYPTQTNKLDFRQIFTHQNHETLIPNLLPDGVQVLHTVPREREGGAFVWFHAPPSFYQKVIEELLEERCETQSHGRHFKTKDQRRMERKALKEDALGKVIAGISQYLKTHPVKAFLCNLPVRAHRVEGEPYLEDLRNRYPSSVLRIRIDGPKDVKLDEEDLFARLRRYGQLSDIQASPDGESFKASFNFSAAAISARNCLHRAPVHPENALKENDKVPVFHIEFEAFMRKWLRDLIFNNARLAIPLIAFGLVSTTYLIWDPMRTAAVQTRVATAVCAAATQEGKGQYVTYSGLWGKYLELQGHWKLSNWWSSVSSTMSSTIAGYVSLKQSQRATALIEDFWEERAAERQELSQWLKEPQDRVMLLTGPRGNGQGELVRYLLDGGKGTGTLTSGAVLIDVSEMLDQSSDEYKFLRRLCRAFGYAPAPLAERHLSSVLDMLIPGSSKLDHNHEVLSTVQRVLSCTTQALIDLRSRRKNSSGHEQAPAPLFVIDGFTAENKDRHNGFIDILVSWAAYVTDAHLARVLFIADSSFGEPTLLSALHNRPDQLEVLQLRDADLDSVQSFLCRQLGSAAVESLSKNELSAVGGRFRDVAALVAHVKEGETPTDAVRRLIETAAAAVRTLLVYGQKDAEWTRPQLWRAVRLLSEAESEGVMFDNFLWTVFRGDEAALRSMLRSNLITITTHPEIREGRLRRRVVQPGSPLYAEVYRRLVRQPGNSAVLDLEVAKDDIKREQGKISEYEAELVRLQEVDDVRREKGRDLPDPNKALLARKEQLLGLIAEQHRKLERYHKARRRAQAILGSLNKNSTSAHVSQIEPGANEVVSPEKRGFLSRLWF